MDEQQKPQPNTDFETREKIANQLDSLINPGEKPKNNVSAISYFSGSSIKTEPTIKINTPNIPEEQPKQIFKPIVRTYKSDVEETVQTGHISSINIALAQSRKMMGQAAQTQLEEKKSTINKSVLILSIVLIIGGLSVFFVPKFLVQVQNAPEPTPIETISSKPIMTVDLQEKINIKDINLNRVATTLKERIDQSSTQLGQIKNLYLTEGEGVSEKLINATKFSQIIGLNMPSEIQRTLKDPFMFGMHNYNGVQTFLILKIGSFDTSFSGMLKWEINLWQDFKELFNLKSESIAPGEPSAIEIKKFQDATFDNKDCRVVKNSSGNVIFLYSIIDQNTIVITTNTGTLREIINRMNKARIVTQ